jgi:hypothetical protein
VKIKGHMQAAAGQYILDIYHDEAFQYTSIDSVHKYDYTYLENSKTKLPTMFGIKVYVEDQLIKSAIIGSTGGGTTIHKTAAIFETNRFLICCSDSVFCLSIPDLKILWHTQADWATCFEIFKYRDSYIVHGKLEITRLDKDGNIIWQRSGANIFITLTDEDGFQLTKDFIIATDIENRVYKFDYNGKDFTDMSQFP